MANPTSNFNWQMPTNTDLVKDLPADFEVFGQAVDTSLADLKGGTSGQILSKNSNTDMDFVWIANDQGDITAVNVTSPITGGGSSGAVTVGIDDGTTAQKGAVQLEDSTSSTSTTKAATPNSVKSAYDLANAAIPKSLVDAAGDLIYATANDTVARLALGTAGQVLKVNSGATAPEWGAASTAFVGCSVYKSASQSLSNEVVTTITWDTEDYDTDSIHSTSANTDRFTVPTGKGGKWLFSGVVMYAAGTAGYRGIRILKNGNTESYQYFQGLSTVATAYTFSQVWNLAAADYLSIQGDQSSGGNLDFRGTTTYSRATFTYLGA